MKKPFGLVESDSCFFIAVKLSFNSRQLNECNAIRTPQQKNSEISNRLKAFREHTGISQK